jgi:hypothetical protein
VKKMHHVEMIELLDLMQSVKKMMHLVEMIEFLDLTEL